MDNKEQFMKAGFQQNIRKYTMLIALVSIWVIFSVLTEGVFFSTRNLTNLFVQTVTVAIIAVGMTLIIVTGNIDLSVGSIAAFTGAVGAYFQVKMGLPTGVAIALALCSGLLVGTWHGFWIAYRMVPAFIVTLASMMAFRGAVLGITGGATIAPLSGAFKAMGQAYLPRKITALIGLVAIICYLVMEIKKRQRRIHFGFKVPTIPKQIFRMVAIGAVLAAFFGLMTISRGMPYAVFLVLLLTLGFHFISRHTVFGRQLYAIGGNVDAAKLSGIPIKKRIMALYVVFGAITAVAGLVLTARLNAATTSAGVGLELDAIAATVIGGTSLMGGEGTVFGALVGALIMASLDNGMSLMDTNITYQYVIKGLILLLAVWVDIATRRAAH